MELIRPLAEELTLLDEQRRQAEAKVAQVMLFYPIGLRCYYFFFLVFSQGCLVPCS